MMNDREKSELRHSSGEVAEQNRGTGSGGDGAKDGGRGEREPATHAPDTEPGKRVTDAGARTDGRKVLPSLSEVGAGCGKAARPVLGGGTRVTWFPTAIQLVLAGGRWNDNQIVSKAWIETSPPRKSRPRAVNFMGTYGLSGGSYPMAVRSTGMVRLVEGDSRSASSLNSISSSW